MQIMADHQSTVPSPLLDTIHWQDPGLPYNDTRRSQFVQSTVSHLINLSFFFLPVPLLAPPRGLNPFDSGHTILLSPRHEEAIYAFFDRVLKIGDEVHERAPLEMP
jgi:hypothetical protein